jgi:rod shape-determining protein MreC
MRLNNHKKKIDKKYVILFGILGICIALGLMSLIIRDDRSLTFAEKALKDVGLSVEKVLYSPIRFVIDRVDNYKEMKKVYLKYKDIDKVESKASLLETENKELRGSLEELKKTLELNELITEYDTINASIINRNVGEWYNTLAIDKGEKSGLKPEMIVINNSGLIGIIIKTTFYTSDVKLIKVTSFQYCNIT